MSHPYPFISVMGTMGVGKTTAVQLIADKLHAYPAFENFENNPFLPRFYQDMKRWGFTYQMFFLMEKIKQAQEIEDMLQQKSVIEDTSVLQFVYSYAKAQYKYGNMDEEEWNLYSKIYEKLNTTLAIPDMIIYLDASIDTTMQRITSRGRNMESNIPRSYVELLDSLNKEWLKQNTDIPVYTINTDHLNLVSTEKDKDTFISSLTTALNQKSLHM